MVQNYERSPLTEQGGVAPLLDLQGVRVFMPEKEGHGRRVLVLEVGDGELGMIQVSLDANEAARMARAMLHSGDPVEEVQPYVLNDRDLRLIRATEGMRAAERRYLLHCMMYDGLGREAP